MRISYRFKMIRNASGRNLWSMPRGISCARNSPSTKAQRRFLLEEATRVVHALGGLVIPAHITRPAKGLLGVLGLWPSHLTTDAAEVSPRLHPSEARQRYPLLPDVPLITNSDAHWLDVIGQVRTTFFLAAPTIAELRRALHGVDGRSFHVP